MAYARQTWFDDSGGGTPISAARLNYLESGVEGAHTTADSAAAGASSGQTAAGTAQTTADSALAAAGAAQVTANAAVPKSLAVNKGDLLVGSAASTVGRLPIGTDGRILEADSAATVGVKWGRKITISATAPGGPSDGDIWIQPGVVI